VARIVASLQTGMYDTKIIVIVPNFAIMEWRQRIQLQFWKGINVTPTPKRYRVNEPNETGEIVSNRSRYSTIREYELRQLEQLILLPVTEIDCQCICTWVYDHVHKSHRLKFKHKTCPAYSFHREIENDQQNVA
jgi:hypothetical protein